MKNIYCILQESLLTYYLFPLLLVIESSFYFRQPNMPTYLFLECVEPILALETCKCPILAY